MRITSSQNFEIQKRKVKCIFFLHGPQGKMGHLGPILVAPAQQAKLADSILMCREQ